MWDLHHIDVRAGSDGSYFSMSHVQTLACLKLFIISKQFVLTWFRFNIKFIYFMFCVLDLRYSFTVTPSISTRYQYLFSQLVYGGKVELAIYVYCVLSVYFADYTFGFVPYSVSLCILFHPVMKLISTA